MPSPKNLQHLHEVKRLGNKGRNVTNVHLHGRASGQRIEGGWWCYLSFLDVSKRGFTVCSNSHCFGLGADDAVEGVLIGELNLLFLIPHFLTTSPSSNTTWHSKGLTEPSATPLSLYIRSRARELLQKYVVKFQS